MLKCSNSKHNAGFNASMIKTRGQIQELV